MTSTRRFRPSARAALALASLTLAIALACVASGPAGTAVQRWWKERGPVVPHENFPADCSLCHEGRGWNTIRADFSFDHERETGVKLEGAHARAECLRCHNDRGPVEVFAARGCAGCHEDPHRSQMGPDCTACHQQEDWELPEQMALHARTRFPLVGAHAVAACWRCHPGAQTGNFARVDTSCEACHQSDLARALNPDHAAQGWITDCQRCHLPVAWGGASFTHGTWPLTGQHAVTSCNQCHPGGVFAGTPNQCVDCHLAEYQGTTDPNHAAFNFPTDCAQCHSTSTWQGAHFSHAGIVNNCVSCHLPEYQNSSSPDHQLYNFPTTCEQCHVTTSWDVANFNHSGIVNNCVSCHLPDYQNATSPDHQLYSLPTTCEQCHVTTSWDVNNFNHSGISSGCANCHMAEYQTATDPNHSAAGLGTTCEQCHTSTINWRNENWVHSWFPIKSGKHNGMRCSECHLTNTNYLAFSCTHCHEHRQSEMNDKHQGVSGYTWQSPACYQCHPDGQE